MTWRLVAVLLAAATLAGCGDDRSPTSRYAVEGGFAQGDASSRFVATFVDSSLVKVEETQHFGDLGEAEVVYEVDDGQLVYYRRNETRQRMNPDASGREQVELELEFTPDGRLLRGVKLVDGEPSEMLGYEAPGARRHFAELSKRAREAGATASARLH
jgi:hypothetical protein